MPFTFAHPIAVLPFLKRNYFSATGLIVGSIVPDFESFFKMRAGGEHSHTLAGILYFDLPIGCILALIFHMLIKETLIDNSPLFIQQRFCVLRQADFVSYFKKNYWIVGYSILLGAATHLLWDGFTHGGGIFVKQVEFLNKTRIPFQGVRYPLWYSLQHFFSVVGLLILSTHIIRMPISETTYHKPSWIFWLLIVSTTGGIFYLRFIFGPAMNEGNTVVALVSALLGALLLVTLLFRRFKRSL